MLRSQLCTLGSLTSPELLAWSARLRPMWDPDGTDERPVLHHRKMWEWLFIARVLEERDMLRPGRRGLGFGVGQEPLVAAFAATGSAIVATDLDPERARAAGWTETGSEYAGALAGLNAHGLCPEEQFASLVSYRHVDMTQLPDDLGTFDFTWSSCAFEHLGTLDAGMEFVMDQMRFVAPGGVAVHTTECNVSSDTDTVESGGTVLYRRRDIDELVHRLRRAGYRIDCDLTEGDSPEDRHVDVPPFTNTHLRTTLGQFVTTSVALVVERPAHRPKRLRGAWRPSSARRVGRTRPFRV
ncbi:MAG: class I SAM-dependent methyltransferase [Actinomycetota bacterium]|nr:class I SAM-dependent methyltransferase [Actinomycetota bacterium]